MSTDAPIIPTLPLEVEDSFIALFCNYKKTIEHMCKDGIQRFIAIGPGVSLAAYAREKCKTIGFTRRRFVLEKYDDLATIIQR